MALGTIKGYEFPRAIELVSSLIEEKDFVYWQLGSTKKSPNVENYSPNLERFRFLEMINNSDVVVCHAGIGIISDCLNAGKIPILIPRRFEFSEHVDDHQVEIVDLLLSLGTAKNLEVETSRELLYFATQHSSRRKAH